MKRGYIWSIPLALIAVAVAAPLLLPAHGKDLPAMENKQGPVRVAVTPQTLSQSANAWRFTVQFNSHVMEIAEDMVAVSSLSAGKADVERPTAWEGDPPGGHHRKGVLVFKPIIPMPATITLHIREVGGVADRAFTWKLSKP